MPSTTLLDICGRRRSPATLPDFHQGHPPRNKGLSYPADPPTVEEIVAVMRAAGNDPEAVRLRGLIVVLWRAGLRISEALALTESDLDPSRGAILVRHGKGGKRREVGMDRWGWQQLDPWLQLRAKLPVGALFCVLLGPTRGRPWRQPASAPSCTWPPAGRGCAAGLRRTSCAMLMPSKCPAKACRCWSSNANWATPISRSPPCICAGSTTPRSSTPSMERPAPMIPATNGLSISS